VERQHQQAPRAGGPHVEQPPLFGQHVLPLTLGKGLEAFRGNAAPEPHLHPARLPVQHQGRDVLHLRLHLDVGVAQEEDELDRLVDDEFGVVLAKCRDCHGVMVPKGKKLGCDTCEREVSRKLSTLYGTSPL